MEEKKRLEPEDVESLVEALEMLEKAVRSVRWRLLCAMDKVNYATGRRPMDYLYRAQGDIRMALAHVADMLPRSVLPASDIAPDMIDAWLRKGVDRPQPHEGEPPSD